MTPPEPTVVEPPRAAPAVPDVPGGPARPRVPQAAGGGVVTAIGVFLVVHLGLVPGLVALLLGVVLLVAVPTSPVLPHRLATNLALLMGWAPLTWWVDWPVHVDHGATIAALAAGGLTAHVLWRGSPRDRVRSLPPAATAADLMIPLVAVVGAVAVAPLALAGSARQAFLVLVPGADNWAHFAMFVNLRAYGATTDALGAAPDGSSWGFGEYPKSFHSLVATWSELFAPHLALGPDTFLVYAHGVGVVLVLGLVLLVSAVLTLPTLRERPLLAAPAVALTVAAFLWEPGQKVLANAFANFWLGALAAAAALLLGLAPRRTPAAVHLLAVAGLGVVAAQTWTPLVILAAPAVLMVLVPTAAGVGLGRPGRRLVVAAVCVVLLVSFVGVKAVTLLLGSVSVSFLLAQVSGFDGTSPLPTFLLLVLVVALVARSRPWSRSRGEADPERLPRARVLLLGGAVLAGFAALAAVLVLQLQILGTTSYYFLKFLVGFELVLAGVVPALAAHVVGVLRPQHLPRGRALAVCAASVVLATQLMAPGWRAGALLWSSTDDGTAAIMPPYSREGIADGVLAALDADQADRGFEVEYVPVGKGNALQLFYPDAWFQAARATVTHKVLDRIAVLRVTKESDADVAPRMRTLLEQDPDVVLLVPADRATGLTRELGSPELAGRVQPFGG